MKFMRPIDANDESFRVSLATRQLPWYRRYLPSFTIKRLLKCVGLVLYIVVGCIFYHRVEGWRPFETLYFTVVTIATVGYGYDHPTADSSRLFTIFYAPLGVYVIYYYVGKEITKWFGVGMRYIKSLELDEAGVMLDRQKKLTIAFIVLMVIFILASGGVFVALEPEWSYIEGVYFAVQTTTTIGYGDLSRPGTRTKTFLVFYIVFSTLLSAFIYNSIQLLHAEKKQVRKLQDKLKKRQDLEFLAELDRGDGVKEADFILAVLEHIGTLNRERDISPWKKKFQEMDSGNGRVFRDTLMEFSSRESVYAKEAVAMIGNIESSVIFDSIVNVGKNAQPSAGKSQTQTDKADMSKTNEMELGDIQNPLKEDA